MVIHLTPELEAALNEQAKKQHVTPEALALEVLRKQLVTTASKLEPRDEWERGLLEAASHCGVSLSDEDLSREAMYD